MPFPESNLARSGRFTKIRPIGRGAAGQVYAAQDNLGRTVAVKELLPTHRAFQQLRERFELEARIQAALACPQIIAVYQLDEDPQTHELYLVTEYADGGSLAALLDARGPLPEALALKAALDLCAALEVTSARGIVHRDLKPSNMLVCNDGQGRIAHVKLADFGVARDRSRRQTTVIAGYHHPGTPQYMAPEQGDISNPIDVRTDIYALGISLWELLTNEDYKLLRAQQGPPDLLAFCPGCSPDTQAIIERAVQDDPTLRYQTPQELASDLRAVLDGSGLAAKQTIQVGKLPLTPFTAARTTAPQLVATRPQPLRATVALLLLIVATLGGGFMIMSNITRQQQPAQAPAISSTESPPLVAAIGLDISCHLDNLIACGNLVPVYVPGESEAAATPDGAGSLQVVFRNPQQGSGLALQFAPALPVSDFTHLRLVASTDQPLGFAVEYKQGPNLEVVRRSADQRLERGAQVLDIPIAYDGLIDELVLVFPTVGESARLTIESLTLR